MHKVFLSTFKNKNVRIFSASSMLAQALARTNPRRPRGEKKPIPDEQKDERYFERRKRNNLAAKKSRDQRKLREDAIGMRASFLEKDNAILRSQVSTLREERNSLQGLILRRQLQQKQRAMINMVVEQQQKHLQFLQAQMLRQQVHEQEIVDLSLNSSCKKQRKSCESEDLEEDCIIIKPFNENIEVVHNDDDEEEEGILSIVES
jgi:hypothetical protein